MARFNQMIKRFQRRNLMFLIVGCFIVLMLLGCLMGGKPPKKVEAEKDLVGVMDESFTALNTQSALTAEQAELDELKAQLQEMKVQLQDNERAHKKESKVFLMKLQHTLLEAKARQDIVREPEFSVPKPVSSIHRVSFSYHKKERLTPFNYVPSGTFAKAIILGGTDADASVNGQSKNNGVMLFKLVAQGTLPNGQHSRLKGCFLTGSAFGDISSERAYVVLDKLSCAKKGEDIIDKVVTGWAFFGGKVGIKGIPLMRDNKVMQWAGMSGALAGIASAAQYSRSVQSISPLGSATTVPSGNIAPYAAYGGASKSAEVLSDYYVKRAEQYHPVIQVGAGNYVTIVFKDGFYLTADEGVLEKKVVSHGSSDVSDEENLDFKVPEAVLHHIHQGEAS